MNLFRMRIKELEKKIEETITEINKLGTNSRWHIRLNRDLEMLENTLAINIRLLEIFTKG